MWGVNGRIVSYAAALAAATAAAPHDAAFDLSVHIGHIPEILNSLSLSIQIHAWNLSCDPLEAAVIAAANLYFWMAPVVVQQHIFISHRMLPNDIIDKASANANPNAIPSSPISRQTCGCVGGPAQQTLAACNGLTSNEARECVAEMAPHNPTNIGPHVACACIQSDVN